MLHELTLLDFRNIQNIHFPPDSQINLIFGDNGAGKSSLLEAIDFLSRGRSFRTRLVRTLIREGCESLTVAAVLESGHRLGTRRIKDRNVIRTESYLDSEAIPTQAQAAAALPVIVFHTNLAKQTQSDAKRWRSLLDWGVFHVKPAFSAAWKKYRHVLRQRNRLLLDRATHAALAAWDQQLVEQSEILDTLRREYAGRLINEVSTATAEHAFPLDLDYVRGWDEQRDLGSVLAEAEADDRRVGYTRYGPHRATLRLFWERVPVSERASQGQQKMIAAHLVLAQVRLFAGLSKQRCVVLVDDLVAAFDERHCRWMLEELAKTGQQVFITATHDIKDFAAGTTAKRFHMKHGELSASGGS